MQRPSWQTIHRALQGIAKRRAGLDAEEALWLREADRCQIWRELGMVSAIDYIERVLGYGPEAAKERLRVAHALEALPVLTNALADGQFPYCAVRELTRVVTPETESAWCDSAVGKNVHQIEAMVAGHKRGDRPDDPPDPKVRTHVVKLELAAETFVLFRQAHQVLDEEAGRRLSDDELVAALCGSVLDRGEDAGEPTGRAKFQIALTVCKRCQQGWQEGAGVQVAVDASTVERAQCDAQEIGSIDGAEPERAHQDVPPSVMRLVHRRDGGRCRVPGCRSSRACEVHHLVHREHGGSHEASNLILLCSACHAAHHRGKLKISGTANELKVERCEEARFHVGPKGEALVANELEVERREESRFYVGQKGALAANELEVERCANTRFHVGPKGKELAASEREVERCEEARFHVGPKDEARAADEIEVERRAEPQFHVGPKDEARAADEIEVERRAEARFHVGPKDEARAASERKVERCAEPRFHVGPKGDALAASVTCTQAKEALVGMGWKRKIATAAVQEAARALGEDFAIERLIFEALRRCPRPVS